MDEQFHLPETLGLDNAAALIAALDEKIVHNARLELDGSKVTKIGQTGLQLLLSAKLTAQNRQAIVAFVNPSQAILDVLTICGKDETLLSTRLTDDQ